MYLHQLMELQEKDKNWLRDDDKISNCFSSKYLQTTSA